MPTPREIMEAEMQRLREQAEQIEHDMRELERLTTKYDLCVVAVPKEPLQPPEKITRGTYVKAAREVEGIIRATGHPMDINELYKIVVVDRGFELTGNNPTSQLAATMISSGKLFYYKDLGWWVKGVPWPASEDDIAKMRTAGLEPEPEAPKPPGRQRSPTYQAIFEKVRDLLKDRAEPMKFGDIYDQLRTEGLVKAESRSERQRIATFICTIHCFKSHKKDGWRYIPEFDTEKDLFIPNRNVARDARDVKGGWGDDPVPDFTATHPDGQQTIFEAKNTGWGTPQQNVGGPGGVVNPGWPEPKKSSG